MADSSSSPLPRSWLSHSWLVRVSAIWGDYGKKALEKEAGCRPARGAIMPSGRCAKAGGLTIG
jgi:hypothetical protein